METFLETEDGGVIMKEIEKYAINKTNFKKLLFEGKIDENLIKYLPKPKTTIEKNVDLKKYINILLFDKFD